MLASFAWTTRRARPLQSHHMRAVPGGRCDRCPDLILIIIIYVSAQHRLRSARVAMFLQAKIVPLSPFYYQLVLVHDLLPVKCTHNEQPQLVLA